MRLVPLLVCLVNLALVSASDEKHKDRLSMGKDVWRGRRFILNDINLDALGIVDGAVDMIENNDELGAWLGVPEETPGETLEETPGETPEETPGESLEGTPEETPGDSLEETPEETPGELLEETPEETPGESLEETPEETPGESLEETPEETPGESPDEEPGATPPETADGGPWPSLPAPAMPTSPEPGSCYQVTLDIATKPYDQIHWEDPESGALANIKDLLGSLSGDGQVELVSTAKVHNLFFTGCTVFTAGHYMRESTLKVTSSSAEHTMELINALAAGEEVAHSIQAVDRSLCGVDVLRYTSMMAEDPLECEQSLS